MWLRNISSGWHASGEGSIDAAAMEKEGVGAVLGKESQKGKAGGHGARSLMPEVEEKGASVGERR